MPIKGYRLEDGETGKIIDIAYYQEDQYSPFKCDTCAMAFETLGDLIGHGIDDHRMSTDDMTNAVDFFRTELE